VKRKREKEVELLIIRKVFLLGMSRSLVGIRDQQLGIKDSNVTIPFFSFDVKIWIETTLFHLMHAVCS
jgi:hypothetical protein